MTERGGFEATADLQRGLFQKSDRASAERTRSENRRFTDEEAWRLCRLSDFETFRFPHGTMESLQTCRDDTLVAGMARWDCIFGLLDRHRTKSRSIQVDIPSQDWFWCAQPAMTSRICLKKRLSILSVFDS
jgi:hypothetical protein